MTTEKFEKPQNTAAKGIRKNVRKKLKIFEKSIDKNKK